MAATSLARWVVTKNSGTPAQAMALEPLDAAAVAVADRLPSGANIVVRVTHAALNPADLHHMLVLPIWLPFRRRPTPGLDFAGEIVQLGPQAAAAPGHAMAPLAVGDCVAGAMSVPLVATGHGALTPYVVVPAELVARVPDGLAGSGGKATGAAAGLLGVAGQTAHLVLTSATAEAVFASVTGRAPRVVVIGASGGVGSLLVQAAKARGAHVVGVCSAANTSLVTDTLGADAAIDYSVAPLPEQLAAYTSAPNIPFDLVLDCFGEQALFSHSPSYLQPRGAFLTIAGGPTMGIVPFMRNRLRPTLLGGVPRTWQILGLAPSGACARQVAAWYAAGTIKKMLVDAEYAMADAVQAYEKLATKHAKGKIVVRVQ